DRQHGKRDGVVDRGFDAGRPVIGRIADGCAADCAGLAELGQQLRRHTLHFGIEGHAQLPTAHTPAKSPLISGHSSEATSPSISASIGTRPPAPGCASPPSKNSRSIGPTFCRFTRCMGLTVALPKVGLVAI